MSQTGKQWLWMKTHGEMGRVLVPARENIGIAEGLADAGMLNRLLRDGERTGKYKLSHKGRRWLRGRQQALYRI